MIDGDDAIQEFKIHFEDEVMNGHFYSFTSVEEFLFELDPTERLLKQNKIKSVPIDAGIKLILNETGEYILGTEPDLTPGQTLFGYRLDELKKLHLLDLITDEVAKSVLKKFLSGEIVLPHEERIFSVERNRIEYLFRIESQEFKESKKKNKTNELFLKELTDAEKITRWKKKSKFPQYIDAILIRDIHFDSNKVIWDSIQERLKLKSNRPFLVFLNAYRKKTEKDLKENEKFFTNIFFKSKEKSFLLRRLSIYFSNLKLKKPYYFETMIKHQVIEVGNPIHVKELSEAGLVLEYNRAIDLGEFRKFILWRPEETEMPTFLAICNYAEEDKSTKGSFLNHFVFYAINDFYLKHLRLWLLANYIHQKEGEGS